MVAFLLIYARHCSLLGSDRRLRLARGQAAPELCAVSSAVAINYIYLISRQRSEHFGKRSKQFAPFTKLSLRDRRSAERRGRLLRDSNRSQNKFMEL